MGETAWEDMGFCGDTFRALLHLLCLLCPAVENPSHEKGDFARYLGVLAAGKASGAEFGVVYDSLLSLSPCGRLTEVSESGRQTCLNFLVQHQSHCSFFFPAFLDSFTIHC